MEIKKRYRDMPVKNKIIVVTIPILLFLAVMVLIISSTVFSQAVLKKTKTNIQDECDLLIKQINGIYENMITCSEMLTKDINSAYANQSGKQTPASLVTLKNQIFTSMDYDRRCFPEISSVVFVALDDYEVSNGIRGTINMEKLSQEMVVVIPSQGSPLPVSFPIGVYTSLGEEEPVFTIGRRVLHIPTGNTLGYIFISVKEEAFSEIFPGEENRQEYYLVDSDNRICVSHNKEQLFEPIASRGIREQLEKQVDQQFQVNVEGMPYLISQRLVNRPNWSLVRQISVHELNKEVYYNIVLIVTISLLTVALAGYCVLRLANIITSPILRLNNLMERVREGDLNVSCPVDSVDEVGKLSGGFNSMLEQIRRLISQVREEQRRKGEYRLALSQAQIKPHFLYNSLDLVYVLSKMGDAQTAAVMTKALADFYRVSLSGGDEIITIQEEKSLTHNYLTIQHERYTELIRFRFELADEALPFLIPKMTLQPLVENSIYHGLKEKDEGGEIIIGGELTEKGILLYVKDDGVGMDQDMAEKVLDQNPDIRNGHFGLGNVNERIKLYFGREYGLSVKSGDGEGTIVNVFIPRCLEKKEITS